MQSPPECFSYCCRLICIEDPTCETNLQTAVQTEKLHSLHRLKNAFKVMDRLRPHIQSAQGTLSREDTAKMPARRVDDQTVKGPSLRIGTSKTTPGHENGRAHMILFILLLFDGVLAISAFFFSHVTVTLLSSVTAICLGIFVIIALVKQHNSDMPDALRTITWASLGFVGITFAAGYAASMVIAFKNPAVVYNQWQFFKSMSILSPRENPLVLGIDIFSICGALLLRYSGTFPVETKILGTLGLINFRQFSEQSALLVKIYFATKCKYITVKNRCKTSHTNAATIINFAKQWPAASSAAGFSAGSALRSMRTRYSAQLALGKSSSRPRQDQTDFNGFSVWVIFFWDG